ncbi:MAG TPA: gamma-glutamyltransferase [Polyangiaceae bacterium]|nr:gamma-glutamyltransferase [Polyangiaceae bacterium]
MTLGKLGAHEGEPVICEKPAAAGGGARRRAPRRPTFAWLLAALACASPFACESGESAPPVPLVPSTPAPSGTAPPPPPPPPPRERYLPPEPPSGYDVTKDITFAERDMVSAATPPAVDAGVQVLAAGGSAVDAAIAVQMVLNLVEPQSSGIGGGAFLTYYDAATKSVTTYDGRETAPAGAEPGQFLDATGAPRDFFDVVGGGLSVGTPGLLRMLELAHQKHGKLPWAGLFDRAIALSEGGFEISPRLHVLLEQFAESIRAEPAAAAYFLNPDGKAKAQGERLTNPDFAATLRAIAAGGADAFYEGPIAQAMVDAVRNHPRNPGTLALSDLAGYQAKERPALCSTYRQRFRVCGMGMPSSGTATVAMTLAMLERFDLAALRPNTVESAHRVLEAYKLAYADRAAYMADEDFVPVPVEGLLDSNYLAARAALIDPAKAMAAPGPGSPPGVTTTAGLDESLSLPSTSHISIVDRDGNAVSMTTTIEYGFGSLQLVRGFLLNNELTDFSFRPADAAGNPIANRLEPGKRPRSSMSPVVVLDNATGDLELVIGSPGGSAIIQFVTKAILGVADWKLDIQQAVSLPHFGAGNSPDVLLEAGSFGASDLEAGLKQRGHSVRLVDLNSGLQGIVFNGTRADGTPGAFARHPGRGTWAGGSDPRREGVSRGTAP